MSIPALPNQTMTEAQSQEIATVLFPLTVQRMRILIGSLIEQTASGDYALWAPLAALDMNMRDLHWESVSPAEAEQFARLVTTTCRRYADRVERFADAVRDHAAGQPFPTLLAWTDDDTTSCYPTHPMTGDTP